MSQTAQIFVGYMIVHAAVASALPLPSWSGAVPDPNINASAGLPLIDGVVHRIVYNATLSDGSGANPFGTYNHGPIMIAHEGVYYMSWYNSPRDEDLYKRSVFSTSTDGGISWSEPFERPCRREAREKKAGKKGR